MLGQGRTGLSTLGHIRSGLASLFRLRQFRSRKNRLCSVRSGYAMLLKGIPS
jgi:hypothetical protein